MNQYTDRAYRFFHQDKEAKEAMQKMIAESALSDRLANNLAEYVEQLSHMELLAIFRAVTIKVTEAVDWKEIAYMLLADELNVWPTAGESIPEWADNFDSNDQ